MITLKKLKLPEQNCPECSRTYTPHREGQVFCNEHCRHRFNNKIKKSKKIIKDLERTARDRISEEAEKRLSFQEKLLKNVEGLDGLQLKDGLNKVKLNLLKRMGIDLSVYEGIYAFHDHPTSYYKVVGPYEICLWEGDTLIIKKSK